MSERTGVMSIISRIRTAIEALGAADLARDPVRLRCEAMRANVRASVNHLRHGSEVIERLASSGDDGLLVVGAELDLLTGVVDFFEGVSAAPKHELVEHK